MLFFKQSESSEDAPAPLSGCSQNIRPWNGVVGARREKQGWGLLLLCAFGAVRAVGYRWRQLGRQRSAE
eukprot:156648-Chlamydomonas_euryale.AAC.3